MTHTDCGQDTALWSHKRKCWEQQGKTRQSAPPPPAAISPRRQPPPLEEQLSFVFRGFFFPFTSHSPQSPSRTTPSRILTIYQSQNDLCVLQYLQRACIKPGLNSRQWHLSATFFTCSVIPLVVISHSPTAKSAHSILPLSFSHFQMKRRQR